MRGVAVVHGAVARPLRREVATHRLLLVASGGRDGGVEVSAVAWAGDPLLRRLDGRSLRFATGYLAAGGRDLRVAWVGGSAGLGAWFGRPDHTPLAALEPLAGLVALPSLHVEDPAWSAVGAETAAMGALIVGDVARAGDEVAWAHRLGAAKAWAAAWYPEVVAPGAVRVPGSAVAAAWLSASPAWAAPALGRLPAGWLPSRDAPDARGPQTLNHVVDLPAIGPSLWGSATVEGGDLVAARILRALTAQLRLDAEPFVFEPHGPALVGGLRRRVRARLRHAWNAGWLIGADEDAAFAVDLGADGATVWAEVRLRPVGALRHLTVNLQLVG